MMSETYPLSQEEFCKKGVTYSEKPLFHINRNQLAVDYMVGLVISCCICIIIDLFSQYDFSKKDMTEGSWSFMILEVKQ